MKEIELPPTPSTREILDKNPELLTIANNIKKTITYIFKEYEKTHDELFYIIDIALSVYGNSCNVYLGIENPIHFQIFLHCHLIKGCNKEIELERFTKQHFGEQANSFKNLFSEIIDKINKETVFNRFLFRKTLESLLENNI